MMTSSSSHVFVLHEAYGSLLGVFQSFEAAHVAMISDIQSILNGPRGTAFLPSMRFQRVVIEPENRLRWRDTWQGYPILPQYTITDLPLDRYIHLRDQCVRFYDPDILIKNAITYKAWNDRDMKDRLADINKHVTFASGDSWTPLYSDDVEMGNIENIHAWVSRKECEK